MEHSFPESEFSDLGVAFTFGIRDEEQGGVGKPAIGLTAENARITT